MALSPDANFLEELLVGLDKLLPPGTPRTVTGILQAIAFQIEQARLEPEPIPMRLHCPVCHMLHLDEGEFATKPHHTHACQSCGEVWRPALVPTVGVRFLPGFRNEPVNDDIAWAADAPSYVGFEGRCPRSERETLCRKYPPATRCDDCPIGPGKSKT